MLLAAASFTRPARAEGPGIKLGEQLVLHPGVAIGAGYDSNVFYAPDQPQTAFYGSARVGLDLSTLSLQRGGDTPHAVDFRVHAGMPIRFFLSTNSALNQHYSIGADAGLLLSLFPFGTWSFDIFDNFVRTSEPPYLDTTLGNLNLDQNQAGVRLRFRPGGKRFETSIQYGFQLYFWEFDPGRVINGADWLQAKNDFIHDFQFRLKWNFLPKTALYINVDETINDYQHQGDAAYVQHTPPNAFPLRVVAGLLGLLTTKLSVNLNVGYGNSFSQDNWNGMRDASGNPIGYPLCSNPNLTANDRANGACTNPYNMVVGLAEVDWKPTTLTLLNLGYRHDFAQSVVGVYYALDNAYLGFSQQIWRFVGSLRLGWERRDYQGNLGTDGLIQTSGNPTRTDNILSFHVQIDFPIKDYLILSLGDDLAQNWSNCQPSATSLTSAAAAPCNYFRNDVWLRLAFAY